MADLVNGPENSVWVLGNDVRRAIHVLDSTGSPWVSVTVPFDGRNIVIVVSRNQVSELLERNSA
jgi:hypothetical protein